MMDDTKLLVLHDVKAKYQNNKKNNAVNKIESSDADVISLSSRQQEELIFCERLQHKIKKLRLMLNTMALFLENLEYSVKYSKQSLTKDWLSMIEDLGQHESILLHFFFVHWNGAKSSKLISHQDFVYSLLSQMSIINIFNKRQATKTIKKLQNIVTNTRLSESNLVDRKSAAWKKIKIYQLSLEHNKAAADPLDKWSSLYQTSSYLREHLSLKDYSQKNKREKRVPILLED